MDEHALPGAGPRPDHGTDPGPGWRGPDMESPVDSDFAEWAAWFDREVAAGRDPAPPERVAAGEGISISLGDAVDLDPELLAAMCGPQGLGGAALGAQFAEDAAADTLSPSPVLAALTEAAVADVTRLTDDQLVGVLRAARRQESREAWKKALVIAEFTRRRTAEFKDAEARGVPVHCRPGQFPGDELAMELVAGPVQASHAIDDATDLTTRLPATLAGMAAGLIDEARAGVIALYTRCLTAADAAVADGILAALAPTLRLDQLARKAAALEMKLAPEAVKARKEHARRTRQRVEVRREESGNASVAGREMDTGDALASKAHIHALALRLRRDGMPGTLDQLRLLVFTDLTAGRNPLDRLSHQSAPDPEPSAAPDPESQATPNPEGGADQESPTPSPRRDNGTNSNCSPDDAGVPPGDWSPGHAPPPEPSASEGTGGGSGSLDYQDDDRGDHDHGDDPDLAEPAGRPSAPTPAAINLIVHAGTLFGWDTTPSEAGGWGLLDADETGSIVAAASRHPATRWCVTVIGHDGSALAHGCSPGQHPWTPGTQPTQPTQRTQPTQPTQPTSPPNRAGPRTPTAAQAARLDDFLRRLNVTFTPVARRGCDHATAEPRYTPSRRLAHLVRARTATCDAPGCDAQAVHADLDHTRPYPDGLTDQCNLGPKCRRHHKVKQAPGWKVEQPAPGVVRWTLPSGRTHTTRPTVYELCPAVR